MADDRNLCLRCIEKGPLRNWIEREGTEGDCDFDASHTSVPCVTIDEFAEEADRWFQTNYQPGAETFEIDPDPDSDKIYHGTAGRSYDEIFSEELDSSGDVLRAVIDALPDADHYEIAQGGERFYTDAHNFESIEAARAREKADLIGLRTGMPSSGRISANRCNSLPASSASRRGRTNSSESRRSTARGR